MGKPQQQWKTSFGLDLQDGRQLPDIDLTRIVGYIRVSTEEQSRDGDSLAVQRDKILQFQKEHGPIFEGFPEDIGSAYSAENYYSRPGFQDAIRKCLETGAFMAVSSIDRFSRDVSVMSIPGMDRIWVWSIDDKRFFQGEELRRAILKAQRQSEKKSLRITEGMAASKAKGAVFGNQKNLDEAAYEGSLERILHADEKAARLAAIRAEHPAPEEMSWAGRAAELNRLGFLNRKSKHHTLGRFWTRDALRPVWERASRLIAEQEELQAAAMPDWAPKAPSGQAMPLSATESVSGGRDGSCSTQQGKNRNARQRPAQSLSGGSRDATRMSSGAPSSSLQGSGMPVWATWTPCGPGMPLSATESPADGHDGFCATTQPKNESDSQRPAQGLSGRCTSGKGIASHIAPQPSRAHVASRQARQIGHDPPAGSRGKPSPRWAASVPAIGAMTTPRIAGSRSASASRLHWHDIARSNRDENQWPDLVHRSSAGRRQALPTPASQPIHAL